MSASECLWGIKHLFEKEEWVGDRNNGQSMSKEANGNYLGTGEKQKVCKCDSKRMEWKGKRILNYENFKGVCLGSIICRQQQTIAELETHFALC